MNRLSIQQRVQVINALVEGNSIRATCRMTHTAKGTVLRLLAEVGEEIAREFTAEQLPYARWDESVLGTNMHHAFMLPSASRACATCSSSSANRWTATTTSRSSSTRSPR